MRVTTIRWMTCWGCLLLIAPSLAVSAKGEDRLAGGKANRQQEPGFKPLFDGKTFAGWEGNLDLFRIEDGAIVGGNLKQPIPRNEFLCTKEEFGNFELRLKARLLGEGNNAGVQFRSRRIPDHHEVIGYQCDMGATRDGKSIWGALYDESRRRKFLAEGDQDRLGKIVRENEYNDLVIRCEGTRVRLWVNGYQTVDFNEPDENIEQTGIIGLQIHGGKPAEAWYKDIRIKPLD